MRSRPFAKDSRFVGARNDRRDAIRDTVSMRVRIDSSMSAPLIKLVATIVDARASVSMKALRCPLRRPLDRAINPIDSIAAMAFAKTGIEIGRNSVIS